MRSLDAAVLDPRVVRFHPGLGYWTRNERDELRRLGTFPAMLALVSDADGKPATIHRTYLRPDGGWKADVPKAKKLMAHGRAGPLTGAATRLVAPGKTLGIAEGLETALAVHLMTGMPMWSCLSATLLQGFVPPAGIERLVVWADKDASGAGEQAAHQLRERLAGSVPVDVLVPVGPIPPGAKSLDWADIWVDESRASAA
jgi:phage/plasmid primase-like uncharacterized protein